MPSNVVWLFPGQGAQHVGMGKALWETYKAPARVFLEAELALRMELRKLCFVAAGALSVHEAVRLVRGPAASSARAPSAPGRVDG